MKKLFMLTTSLAILTSSFAQDVKKVQPKKAVEEVKKTVEKQAETPKKIVKKGTEVVKEKVAEKANAVKSKTKDLKKVNEIAPLMDKADMPTRAAAIPNPAMINDGVPTPANAGIQQAKPISATEMPAAAPTAPLVDAAKDFEFTNDAYDFGKIPAGKPAKYTLTIKNISSEEQELTLVQPGCGCTTPEYTQGQKIKPGESAKVILGYNGGGATGSGFSKALTVTLKGHNPKQCTFRGETFTVPTESAPTNEAADKLKPAGN